MTDPTHYLTIRRTFPVQPDRAFRAWSEPSIMRAWFSPVGFTTPFAEADVRPGGRYRIGMKPPEGPVVYVAGEFREVMPPDRLVFTWRWEVGEMAGIGDSLVTVEFNSVDEGTEIVLTHTLPPSEEVAAHHAGGWEGCLESLSIFYQSQSAR